MRPVPVPHPLTTARPGGNEGRKDYKMTYFEKIAEVKKAAVNYQITGGLLNRGCWYGENPYADQLIECALLCDLFPETVADPENFYNFRRSDYVILRRNAQKGAPHELS